MEISVLDGRKGQQVIRRRNDGGQCGMATVEALFTLSLALFILFYLFSYGFFFYQRWAVIHVANDTAVRIAETYAYPQSDPVMGFVSSAMHAEISPYRYMGKKQAVQNADRAEKYARWSMSLSSLAYQQGDLDVQVDEIHDALAARHLKVTVTGTYKLPFGGALSYFGGNGTVTYSATSYAMIMDPGDYIDAQNALKKLSSESFGSEIYSTVDSVLSLISKLASGKN